MPREEIFFEQQNGSRQVTVLKSYDQGYARESFQGMDEIAQQHLWAALKPEEVYEAADLLKLGDPNDTDREAEAFLWDELLEQSREDGNKLSFFIVNESVGPSTKSVYVFLTGRAPRALLWLASQPPQAFRKKRANEPLETFSAELWVRPAESSSQAANFRG